jgi:hypothetical protein
LSVLFTVVTSAPIAWSACSRALCAAESRLFNVLASPFAAVMAAVCVDGSLGLDDRLVSDWLKLDSISGSELLLVAWPSWVVYGVRPFTSAWL